jgi:lipoyl(octanoyl) transferase
MLARVLGQVDYLPTYRAMQDFTERRSADTPDELWLCEHPPVFTQGLAGKAEHVLAAGDIPVIATNRGGQVTYHGPGQVVAYPLVDLRRRGYYVKEYVYRLEEAVVRTLAHYGITGHRVSGAPGIYVRVAEPGSHERLAPGSGFEGLGKIAALGVKVSRHCTYHGLAFNVAMDLEPFSRINPCGYESLLTVDLLTIGVTTPWTEAAQVLAHQLDALL